MMEIYGATLHSSPSPVTEYGRALLAENPDHTAASASPSPRPSRSPPPTRRPRYALGSVLNHVLMHQTIIGEEALLQLAEVGETPDLLVGCTGGGSNFGGLAFPFLREKLAGRMNPTIRCVEPAACPSLTKGEYRYDFGDTAGMTPLLKMHTLGHGFIPEPIHAGGLRYHGMAPLVSHIYELGLVEAVAIPQRSASPPRCSSPAARASSRRPSRRTPSPRRSARRWPARRPASRRSSSPPCAATATSTSPPTSSTCPGEMVDFELSDERRSRRRWPTCPCCA